MTAFKHDFPFDPAYGQTLEQLLEVESPLPPEDFADFWNERYRRASSLDPDARITRVRTARGRELHDLSYRSTGDVSINGWVLTPEDGRVERGFICGHGYGGIAAPDYTLPFANAALFFPSLRGLGRSTLAEVSADPMRHVLSGIEDRSRYIHGGCVDDTWLAVSALEQLFPGVEDRIGLLGISFGGGIGMMALPWDHRIRAAHFEVPSFGNQPLRLTLPTVGSGAAVIRHHERHPEILETLRYFDSAAAARFADVPVQIAAAAFDPVVAPPGQFAVYNSLPEDKRSLIVLEAGHFEYPNQGSDREKVLGEVAKHFSGI